MEIISDVLASKDLINTLIMRYGHSLEHNIYHYMNSADNPSVPCFVKLNDDNESGAVYGIMAFVDKKNNEWSIFSVLAPQEKELEIILRFMDYVFEQGTKKLWLDMDATMRKKLLKQLKNTPYRSSKVRFSFETPIFNMKTWDGEQMAGKDWKDMRYYWNKFFKDHKVEFKTASEVSKEDMKMLIEDWKKQRQTGDRAHSERYVHVIDSDFLGYDHTRIMVVDGKVASITAGYKIVNTNNYYSAIGITARDFDRIGEVSNMDDLISLKCKGYDYVDFGNGDKKLNEFKKKFKPEYLYKTFIFSIVKDDKK